MQVIYLFSLNGALCSKKKKKCFARLNGNMHLDQVTTCVMVKEQEIWR